MAISTALYLEADCPAFVLGYHEALEALAYQISAKLVMHGWVTAIYRFASASFQGQNSEWFSALRGLNYAIFDEDIGKW